MFKFRKMPLWYYFVTTVGIAAIVLADQFTKHLAVHNLKSIGTKDFIPGFMRFCYVENDGAAFGMLADKRWIFIVITVIMVLAAAFLLYAGALSRWLTSLPAVCIIGGGIGNLIDRIGNGYVVDMLDVQFMKFAVFNIADIFVCVGAGLVLLALVVDEIREKKAK